MWRHVRLWWQLPCGGRDALRMALPLVLSSASWTLMYFIDRMLLLWYSADALAAALPASLLNFTVVCFFLGTAAYVNTFVSQYYGAGRHERIGTAVWQGVWLGVIAIPLVAAAIPVAPLVFELAGHAPHVRALETEYFQVLCFGAAALVVAQAQASFFTGRGRVRVVMMVDAGAAMLNVGLDLLWIFGYAGFPEGGIAGAGWATVVSQWARVVVYFVLFLKPALRAQFQTIAGCRFDRDLFVRLLRFGSPAGMQMGVELAGFSTFLLLVGRLGQLPLTASNLAFNINSLAFMPVFGFGIAATTMVGQRLGQNKPDLAARATWSVYALATVYMTLIALVYVLLPDVILAGHRAGADPVEFEQLRDVTVVLLRFVAFYCMFDTMTIVFSSAVKGAGDTRFVLGTTTVMSVLSVTATWYGLEVLDQGLGWAWTVIVLYVSLAGVVYLLRFLQGRWRTMRVIESEPAAAAEPDAVPWDVEPAIEGESA